MDWLYQFIQNAHCDFFTRSANNLLSCGCYFYTEVNEGVLAFLLMKKFKFEYDEIPLRQMRI